MSITDRALDVNIFVHSNYEFTTQAKQWCTLKFTVLFCFFFYHLCFLYLYSLFTHKPMKLLKLKKDKNIDIKKVIKGKKKKEWRQIEEDKFSRGQELSKTNQERGRHEDTITCSRPLNGSSLRTAGWTSNILSYFLPIWSKMLQIHHSSSQRHHSVKTEWIIHDMDTAGSLCITMVTPQTADTLPSLKQHITIWHKCSLASNQPDVTDPHKGLFHSVHLLGVTNVEV